jgi:hypothetical protein
MKKYLLTLSVAALAVTAARANLIWYENFNYADGCIETNSAGLWVCHSPIPAQVDSIVVNKRFEISGNASTLAPRQDDVHRDFCLSPCAFTNGPTTLYASFTINCTNLPSTVSNYIAHFYSDSSNFNARVWSIIGTQPGTWRLGISGGNGFVSKIYPVDLAPNTEYQVVVGWDPTGSDDPPLFSLSATLWVNPISINDPSVTSIDAVTNNNLTAVAYAFRQAAGATDFMGAITNLAVATSFNEAATNVWKTNAFAPIIALPPKSATNFVGDAVAMVAVANGQGLGQLTYQWTKNGANVGGQTTSVLTIGSAGTGDIGNYALIATTPYNLAVTSTPAFLWVTNPPVPPTVTVQPTNKTVFAHQTATFTVAATGVQPITYSWFLNNAPPVGTNFSGINGPVLTIFDVQTNNGTTGTYRCDVSNDFGTRSSSNATLTVQAVPLVSIGFLRGLVDPTFYLPTNTTALWSATGIVTSHTNLTTAANSSFYMQDASGGIDVFFGGTTNARPEAGDSVTVIGPLGNFSSLLEMNLTASDPSHSVVTNSHNNPLPAGIVLPFSFTNSPAYGGISNAIHQYQGAYLTFTNVYFPAGFTPGAVFASGSNVTITNQAGEFLTMRVDSRVFDIIGKPVPKFAWTVSGPMGFFLGTTAPNRSAGYQLTPTLYSEIVTNAPPPAVGAVASSAGHPVITWTAQPFMSYSILRATNVLGPYLPIATGLTFNSPAGTYTDLTPVSSTVFYKIASP